MFKSETYRYISTCNQSSLPEISCDNKHRKEYDGKASEAYDCILNQVVYATTISYILSKSKQKF